VARGTYKEEVTINKSVSLIGVDRESTIIDASGFGFGIFVDGTASAPGSGVSEVTVAHFTIKNANFEGILIANASFVTVFDNEVTRSNKALMQTRERARDCRLSRQTKVLTAAKGFTCLEQTTQ
jgi:hypothetical protein